MTAELHELPPAPRILIFRGGAVGDFILTLPVFQALRQTWPRAELTLVGHPRCGALARAAGWLDRLLDIDAARFSGYFAPATPLPPVEAEFIRSFDLVISYLHDPDGAWRAQLIRSGARRVIGVAPRVPAGHAADHFLRALAPLGIGSGATSDRSQTLRRARSTSQARARLKLPAALRAAGRSRLESLGLHGPVMAIHPGSGSVKKNWPLLSFMALAENIRQARLGGILWIVGEADDALARSLEAAKAGAQPVLQGCSLLEVASVLSQCRAYVGNDSGITHLAAAVGIPTVGLFGPTDPGIWGPRGARVALLRGRPPTTKGLERILVEDVFRALETLISAR